MKRTKSELFLEGWLATLKYLDHHKVQGRILFSGISVSMILSAFKVCAPELVTIITALK